jgi:hypothetical protein
MLDSTLINLTESDTRQIEFHYSYGEKIKKLSGFQSGRHFLPKYYSKSLEDFISNISLKEIEEQMVEITDRLRANLNLGISDFSYDVNANDGGLFECPLLTLQIKCIPDQENLNEVIHYTTLFLKTLNLEEANKIFVSFAHPFTFARINLSSSWNLKEFISHLEIFNDKNPGTCSYYYNPSIQYLEINFTVPRRKLILSDNNMDVYFSESFSISDFLESCGNGKL